MSDVKGKHGGKQRLAIFGGAFDPFHAGHSATISHLLDVEKMDRVVVVPSGTRPDKQGVSSADDRLAMARLGVEERYVHDKRVSVSDLQVTGIVGYATIDLVSFFQDNSETEVYVVIGQELLSDLPGWVRSDELKRRAQFLVLQRPGSPVTMPADGWRFVMARPFVGGGVFVSSTELRDRLARGERCAGLLSEQVYNYCVQKQLYGAGKPR